MDKMEAERLKELVFQKHGKMDQKELASLLGTTESSLSKLLKGQCKRQSTEDRQRKGLATLLGVAVEDLKNTISANSQVSASDEQKDRYAIEAAIKVLKDMRQGDVQIPVVDLIWEGIHGVINDMTAPSLEMMEWLIDQLRPISCNPMLRGSRRVDAAFKNLLSSKMQEVWKYMVQRDSRVRERVLRLCMSIKNWSNKPVSEHQISKRLRSKSFSI